MFSIVVECLVGKDVRVDVEGIQVQGRLVHYKPSQKMPHEPESLILRDESSRFLIVKTWDKIQVI